ncbi:MAG TPA: MATE family efflux transporter [Lachnospiraceae bacterium]
MAGLVIPMALQNLINVGVTSADVIMLGRLGETALSAASLAGQVFFVMTLILFGLTSGASVLSAQYWGKKDTETIEKILGLSLRLGIIVGLIFTAIVWINPVFVMGLFSKEKEVIKEGIRYLRVISLSYVLSAITIVYFNIIRSVEKVLVATVTYAVSLGVNIVLNAIFIFGLLGAPKMGVAGAALGTLAARIVELSIMLWYDRKLNDVIRIRLKNLWLRDKVLMKDFMYYAFPVIINELLWGLGMAVVASIMGHMGQTAVAANSVAQVSRQLALVIAFGVSSAAAIILGKTIGENNRELAKRYATLLMQASLVMGLMGSLVILGISPLARHYMSLTDTAKEYLRVMMYVMSFYCVAQSLNCTLIVGIFRSGGDTKAGLIIDVCFMWTGSILFGSLAAFVWHLPVTLVYLILICDEILKLPVAYYRYRSYKWLNNVTR